MSSTNKNFIVLYIIGFLAIGLSIFSILKINKSDSGEVVENISKSIVLKEENGVLKWKYDSDNDWKELYNLINLKGSDGQDGQDGANGKNGKDGKTGSQGEQGEQGPKGDTGPAGADGREIELRAEGTIIQWKYTDATTWTDLIDLSNSSNNQEPSESIVVSVNGNTNDLGCYYKGTSCTNGTLFNIKVNDTTTLDFYVVDSDENTITLIAASNIGNSEYKTVAWYAASSGNNNYGPVTALNVVNNLTNEWTNISAISDYTYNNTGEGYKKIKITDGETVITDADDNTTAISGTTRARLLTYDEAYSLGCRVTANASNCPNWLYANLNAEYNSLTPYGYWLLTSYSNTTRVYNIRNTGILANNAPNDTTGRGIRPVITIKKIQSN
jgi:hypothetical protein